MAYLFSFKSYRRTLATPLRTAHGWWAEREGLLVRLEDEHGRAGYGEAAPIDWFGRETLAEVVAAARQLTGKIPAAALEAVPAALGSLRFALAEARTPAGAGAGDRRLPVASLLPAGRAALGLLPARLAAGFLALKWKVGVERPDEELGLLDDLLAALPAYVKLRLDANGAWDRRQARRWLERCADRPVEFIEQPLAPEDRDGLHGLARDYPVKLALDEAVVSLAEAVRWQSEGWPGLFVIKPALCGPWAELEAWAARTKADVVISSAIETALGRSAVVRRVLAGGLTQRALGLGVGGIFGDRLWDGPETGPWLDQQWSEAINPEALWNALN